MKKGYAYNELSARVCMHVGCIKRIKQRLVDNKSKRLSDFCFEHEPKNRISGHSKRGRS